LSLVPVMLFGLTLSSGIAANASAQMVTYHLHMEASTSAGLKLLTTAGPDAAQAALQTAALQGAATGEKQIAQFDTASGVPNTAGKIPSGATVNAVVWMRKTANLGTMFPRIKARLNSTSGTLLCTATGTTALTTTLTAYTISCTTTAVVTLSASDRLYIWAGVNLTAGSSSGAFRGELAVEGSLNGSADSRVDAPIALPAPTISSLTPNAGPVGTTVTIAGNNFRDQQLGGTVKFFNNRTATVTMWSNTSIVVTVPASSATGNVTVTVAGTTSAGTAFIVGNVPTIANLSPSSGVSGTAVVITGTNFGATKGSSTVKFNGVTAATTSWSTTSITATVPASATTGNVVVTVNGLPSAGASFTVPVLTQVSISPDLLSVPINSQQRFRARAHYSDGSSQLVSSGVTWASTVPSVATITGTGAGLGQTLAVGTTDIQATVGGVTGSTALEVLGPSFTPVGSMSTARLGHSATRLADGRVLVAGGANSVTLTSAELFTPSTRTFSATGSMTLPRHGHSATRLTDGRVLIAGGRTPMFGGYQLPTASAEIFDPLTGQFSATGSLLVARAYHATELLADGRVVFVGGETDGGQAEMIELFDPATGTFSDTGLAHDRAWHSTSTLADGRVLVVGGINDVLNPPSPMAVIYEPVEPTLAPTGSLTTGTISHTSTTLADGTVLVVGGTTASAYVARAERYSPATGLFSTADSTVQPRGGHTANRLGDGSVLVVGGTGDGGQLVAAAERFDPARGLFVGAGSPVSPRTSQAATTLDDGTVLITGGYGAASIESTAELFGPPLPQPTTLSVVPAAIVLHRGDTQQLTVMDELGNQRHDAVWTLSDPELATIGTYGSPTLTAIDYGEVTVTATIGSVTGEANVAIAPISLQVTPTEVTMLVDETRQFTVVDEKGKPTTRATWAVDQPSLVLLTGDPRPWVTAIGSGVVSLTAEVQGISAAASITVAAGTSLPSGTRRWTVPTRAGASATTMVQGGSGEGPGSYVVEQVGNQSYIKALTHDGQQLWELVGPTIASSVPDAFGGLVVSVHAHCDNVNPMTLLNLDRYGTEKWRFTGQSTCPSGPPQMAIRRDGIIAVATPGNVSGFPALMVIDGASSTIVPTPPIPPSSFQSFTGQWTEGYSRIGTPMVDADGAIYVQYEQRTVAYPPEVTSTALKLLKIFPYGSSTTTTLLTMATNTNLFPGRVIPDGQDGVIATYTVQPATGPPDPNPFRAARVGSGVTTYNLPIASPVINDAYGVPLSPELVLGQNSLAFASYGTTLTAFDISSGGLAWNYASANGITIVASDDAGGIVAKTRVANGTDTILRFTSSGSAASSTLGLANVGHLAKRAWTASSAAGGSGAVEGDPIDWANTGWPQPSPDGQNRPRLYRDRPGVPGHQDAAFDMMRALRPAVEMTLHEHGNLICKAGQTYTWGSRTVEGDAGGVDVQAASSCPGSTLWADVHLHVMAGSYGEPNPSGDDLARANGQPAVLRYLSTRSAVTGVPSPLFFRYKGGTPPTDAYASICFWVFGEWRKWSDSAVACGPL
jgi:hypothetical protein